MKNIFDKSDIPLIDRVRDNMASPSDEWTLAVKMINRDGFCKQYASIAALLQRGAACGDPWCMTQLAREYFFHGDPANVPLALSYWSAAMRAGDDGAKKDLETLDISGAINGYKTDGGEYADMEMKCAMLTEKFLSGFGAVDFTTLPKADRIERSKSLVSAASEVLKLEKVDAAFIENLELDGCGIIDGLAVFAERRIEIDKRVLGDIPRLIQVIFHELGHFAVYAMWSDSESSKELRKIYGITPERARTWYDGDMGRSVSVFEEDPDTLSYGVYAQWSALFGALYNKK